MYVASVHEVTGHTYRFMQIQMHMRYKIVHALLMLDRKYARKLGRTIICIF